VEWRGTITGLEHVCHAILFFPLNPVFPHYWRFKTIVNNLVDYGSTNVKQGLKIGPNKAPVKAGELLPVQLPRIPHPPIGGSKGWYPIPPAALSTLIPDPVLLPF